MEVFHEYGHGHGNSLVQFPLRSVYKEDEIALVSQEKKKGIRNNEMAPLQSCLCSYFLILYPSCQ
jgi:hypothetical protein